MVIGRPVCPPTPASPHATQTVPTDLSMAKDSDVHTHAKTPSAQLTNCPKNQPLWSMKGSIRLSLRI